MSISCVWFWPRGPLTPRRLQNELPERLGPFDEPEGEHHEHQLRMVLAAQTPAKRTARVNGAI